MAEAGRPTKRTPETESKILEFLASGVTRKAAAEAVGIHISTFCDWVADFPEFSEAVTRAESQAEAGYAAVMRKAAMGFDAGETVETVSTEFRKRKTTTTDPKTGIKTTVEDEVPVSVTRVTTTIRREFDWRAAESWLKRRRKEDWSDRSENPNNNTGIGFIAFDALNVAVSQSVRTTETPTDSTAPVVAGQGEGKD